MIASASTRACADDLRRLLAAAAPAPACACCASSSDLRIALLTALERLQQRPPGELREQRQQDQEREDRPDEQPGIGLDQRVIHATPHARSAALLQQHDEQREHFGQNRDAFEQEERQVDGAGDLVGGARLARDAFGGGGRELADAERRRRSRSCRARSRRRKSAETCHSLSSV